MNQKTDIQGVHLYQIQALAKQIVLRFLDENDPRYQDEFRAVVARLTKFVIDNVVKG